MTGAEPLYIPELFASLFAAAAPEAGTAIGTSAFAATDAIATGVATSEATLGALQTGLSVGSALQLGSAAIGVAGSTAQALAGAPKLPKPFLPPQPDQARLASDERDMLLKRKGRAAQLLTGGGASGDQSSPNLGSAALLGAG